MDRGNKKDRLTDIGNNMITSTTEAGDKLSEVQAQKSFYSLSPLGLFLDHCPCSDNGDNVKLASESDH